MKTLRTVIQYLIIRFLPHLSPTKGTQSGNDTVNHCSNMRRLLTTKLLFVIVATKEDT